MKLFKKILSITAALALVVYLLPINASAAVDQLDFEDGKIHSGIQKHLNDDGSVDGEAYSLEVVDFNGSKMLKIDPEGTGTPKMKFVVTDLVGEEAYQSVVTLEYDLIIENADGDIAEWNGGTVGATPTGPSNWSNNAEWSADNYEGNVTEVKHLSVTLDEGFEFTDSDNAFFLFMNWGNKGYNNYMDNIRLLDRDGNPVPFVEAGAAEAVEAVEVTETTTASTPKTGVESYSLVFLAGASIMLVGAVALKKRKNNMA